MKKIVVVLALAASVLMPSSAQAAETKFTGAPLTNLDSQGATINIMLLGVPARGGLYIQQCVETAAGARPSLCNNAVQLWISNARGASFLPTDVIKFKPAGSYLSGTTPVDCTVSKCGIFLRYDHTVPGDLSEDQFIPLTFKAASAGAVALPTDEIAATINGIAVTTKPFGRTAKGRPIHQVQNPCRPVATAGHKKGRYIGTIQKALKISCSFFIRSGQLVFELANAKSDFDFEASAFHPFNPCPDLIVFNASRRRDQANSVAFA